MDTLILGILHGRYNYNGTEYGRCEKEIDESIQYIIYVDILLALITGKKCLLQKLHDSV